MTDKIDIGYAEFYITNVCNMSCPGCNRFNDTRFKGTEMFGEYHDQYVKWGEIIKGKFTIIGGEPLLNNSVTEWMAGLREIFPDSNIGITTNGTRLEKVNGLYDTCKDNNITMHLSLHNEDYKDKTVKRVEDFLVGPFKYKYDNTEYRGHIRITDANRVVVLLSFEWWFHQGAIIKKDGVETLHQSDPVKAHDNCHSKTCHHFSKGKLYKCGASALFKEYDNQFNLELSDEDRKLVNNPPCVSADDPIEEIQKFIQNLKSEPIPQCKFCPEVYNGEQIYSLLKKDV